MADLVSYLLSDENWADPIQDEQTWDKFCDRMREILEGANELGDVALARAVANRFWREARRREELRLSERDHYADWLRLQDKAKAGTYRRWKREEELDRIEADLAYARARLAKDPEDSYARQLLGERVDNGGNPILSRIERLLAEIRDLSGSKG